MNGPMLEEAKEWLASTINALSQLNQGPLRCRELSLAITELETGELWLTKVKSSDE